MKKSYIFIIIAIITLSYVFLTESGFCYKEKRHLSKLELVNRTIENSRFKNQLPSSSPPINCNLSNNGDSGGLLHFINILMARKFYAVECVYPKENSAQDIHEPYNWESSITDACGSGIIDMTGGGITESGYASYLKENERFWKGQRK